MSAVKTEIAALRRDVCLTLVRGHRQATLVCPKGASHYFPRTLRFSLRGPTSIHRQRHTCDARRCIAAKESSYVPDTVWRQKREVGLLLSQQVADRGRTVSAKLGGPLFDLRLDNCRVGPARTNAIRP